MSPRYDVFLSHATADKPAVEYLARKLREAGIEPFLDKWHLIPGRVWQTELANGLRNSSACAIFVGSEGFGPWHTQEMLVALDRGARDPGFPVIPVLLPGFRKPAEIPEFLAQRTWVEFSKLEDEDAFNRLVCGIRGEIPDPEWGGRGPVKPSRPSSYRSMAQAPEEFVPRSEYDKVLEALCPKGGGVQSGTTIGITTALRGAGGFGKTALAQQLCQDERVKETYPDGMLWTTMGEDIDANGRLSRIRDLIRWWTREESPAFETAAAAGARLRELVASSQVLIVIDDVWSPADVTPFQGIGNSSALLITTRDSQTLPTGSKKIEVDAMASAEAVELLRSGLPVGEEQDLVSLAARLGEWPLLLKLVNRQLRELVNAERRPIQAAVREISDALDSEGFSAFDREDPESRHAAASRTILVSVLRLPEKERERYFQLAVFPEDAEVPISLLERFWGLSSFQVRKFCHRLHNLSLLLDLNLESDSLRLHDVVRQALMEQVGDQLPNVHRQLLDASRPENGSWADLNPFDKYLWLNLRFHFFSANLRDEFKSLLTDFFFIEAKLNSTDINSLISDYNEFEMEQDIRLIRDALRLATHVLSIDPQELAPQVLGRLLGHDFPAIVRLTEGARSWRKRLWLRPRTASFIRPGGSLTRILEWRSQWIEAVAWVGDGILASGSSEGTIQLWDLQTGKCFFTLGGYSARISSRMTTMAIVGGRYIVSGFADWTVQRWDLRTRQCFLLNGQIGRVTAITAVGDHHAVSSSHDGTLFLWDLETGEILQKTTASMGQITALASVGGLNVVAGSGTGALRMLDIASGQSRQIFEGHVGAVTAVAIVDDQRIITGSSNGTLGMWDLGTGQLLHTLQGHEQGINAVAVASGHRAVSASSDRELRVWDLKAGKALCVLHGHTDTVTSVAVVDGDHAVSGSSDGALLMWDLGTVVQNQDSYESHTDGVLSVAVTNGGRAVSGSFDGTVRIWDLDTGQTLRTLEHPEGVRDVAVVTDQQVLSASFDGTVRLWNLDSGQLLLTYKGHKATVNAVAVLDSLRAVSASDDGTLQVWALDSGKPLVTLKPKVAANSLAILDSRRLISSSFDGIVRVWDIERGKLLSTFQGHNEAANSIAVVDSRRTVSALNDWTLRLWDTETGKTLNVFEAHTDLVNDVDLLGSGRAISASQDRTIVVLDLEQGEILTVLTLDAPIWTVAVTPDKRIVVAGDHMGRVHFFDLVEPE